MDYNIIDYNSYKKLVVEPLRKFELLGLGNCRTHRN